MHNYGTGKLNRSTKFRQKKTTTKMAKTVNQKVLPMKIASFVIRKNASSIEEKDLSNVIMNRVTKLKQQKVTVVLY